MVTSIQSQTDGPTIVSLVTDARQIIFDHFSGGYNGDAMHEASDATLRSVASQFYSESSPQETSDLIIQAFDELVERLSHSDLQTLLDLCCLTTVILGTMRHERITKELHRRGVDTSP